MINNIKSYAVTGFALFAILSWIVTLIVWCNYKNALTELATKELFIQQQNSYFQKLQDEQIKKDNQAVAGEKKYRESYFFEKKQVEQLLDPDMKMDCEMAAQNALDILLKTKK